MKVSFIGLVVGLLVASSGCSKNEEEKQSDAKPEKLASAGELIVKKNCKVCHAQGINGAPIIGNKKMWGDRAAKGKDVLVQSAMNGFGLMPAKGGNAALTESEIKLAVSYMLSQVEGK